MLYFKVSGQRLERLDTELVATGSESYPYIQVDLSGVWSETLCYALFVSVDGVAYHKKLDSKGMTTIPLEVLKDNGFKLSIYNINGSRKVTTNQIYIETAYSGYEGDSIPGSEYTPSAFDELVLEFEEFKDATNDAMAEWKKETGTTYQSMTVSLNGGTTEDIDTFTFDGSAEKKLNITPGKIGAATEESVEKLSKSLDNTNTTLKNLNDNAVLKDDKGVAGGVAELDDSGKVPLSQIPSNEFVSVAGGTMTGDLTLKGDPTENLHAATKQYIDSALGKAEGELELIKKVTFSSDQTSCEITTDMYNNSFALKEVYIEITAANCPILYIAVTHGDLQGASIVSKYSTNESYSVSQHMQVHIVRKGSLWCPEGTMFTPTTTPLAGVVLSNIYAADELITGLTITNNLGQTMFGTSSLIKIFGVRGG